MASLTEAVRHFQVFANPTGWTCRLAAPQICFPGTIIDKGMRPGVSLSLDDSRRMVEKYIVRSCNTGLRCRRPPAPADEGGGREFRRGLSISIYLFNITN